MAVYTALSAADSLDYQIVKKTILHRYDVNEETHRRRFHRDKKKPNESYREWICRITNHFDKWTKDSPISLRDMMQALGRLGRVVEGAET